MNVALTDHAIARYCERVKPALDPQQAEGELLALMEQGRVISEPAWRVDFPSTDCYLELCDGIVLALSRERKGYIATTTLTRGGSSSSRREDRNKRKADRRRARRTKRQMEYRDKRPYERGHGVT